MVRFVVVMVLLCIAACTVNADKNGGSKCAACTLLTGLTEQLMQIDKVDASAAFKKLCGVLPKPLNDVCNLIEPSAAKKLLPLIDAGENPDAVCNAAKFCFKQTATCRLFPKGKHMSEAQYDAHVAALTARFSSFNFGGSKFNICSIVPTICDAFEDHIPATDLDKDYFSPKATLRGSDWRGKDCNDLDNKVFPGRDSHDALVDENCNGIYGIDASTNTTYEQEWCDGTGAMGVAILGDSATAHFRIPRGYFNATMLSKMMFKDLLRNAENEMDWPMLSWSTGHYNASKFAPDIQGPMHSMYDYLVQRNRCNHRDYQNLGVNGAKSANLVEFDTLLSRNKNNRAAPVKPLLLFMAMIGNDVCSAHHGFSKMTTPEAYRANVKAAVLKANTFLPKGSKIVFVPLVDGRILYDTMHARIHPIGAVNNDVTYTDLYDYLNCLEVNPCWGWLNSNATVRNATTAHAFAMDATLPGLVTELNGMGLDIEVHYLGNVIDKAINGPIPFPRYKLIEPVDGFHPSQYGNAIIAAAMWNASLAAGIIPPENPNNGKITAKFGDQGGY